MTSFKIGAFGTGNLGDDLMLQAILKQNSQSRVVAFGKPLIPYAVPFIPYSELLKNPGKYLDECSSLDFGGGNLFWSVQNLSDMLILAQQAKLEGSSVNLCRIGLHGFELNKNYAKMLLKIADSVSVRDSQSREIAMQLGRKDCELERDYVFDLFSDYVEVKKTLGQPLKVGINFADTRLTTELNKDAGFVNHICGVFSSLANKFKNVLEFYYIPFCVHRTYDPENDLLTGNRMWEASQGLIQYVENVTTTDDLIRCVDSMDVLIGHRFHMQVLGYAMHKKVIPLVPHRNSMDKYTAIALDNKVIPICYEGVSQGFIVQLVEQRLRSILKSDS